MQQTLVLLKPDCVQRRLVGAVLQRFERKGLRLASLKLVQADRGLAERHYAVHKGKPFYDSLLQFLTSGPTLALVLDRSSASSISRLERGDNRFSCCTICSRSAIGRVNVDRRYRLQ